MAILNFQKPDKVIMIDSSEFEGKFEFRPLEPGYGLTVGNALRRVLLSSLEGFAITSVKLENVDHEFYDDGIDTIANNASKVNATVENIGARIIHTIIEKILDDIRFTATDRSGEKIVINN